MTLLALTDLGHQYVLYGAAAVICLAIFVTLILAPALSSYGRIWAKAAARKQRKTRTSPLFPRRPKMQRPLPHRSGRLLQ